MKFCILAENYIQEAMGGAEIQCFYIAQEIKKRGHDVYYIYKSNSKRKKFTDNGINVYPLFIPDLLRKILCRIIPMQILMEYVLLTNVMTKIKADYWYYRSFNTLMVSIAKIKNTVGGRLIFAFSSDSQLTKKSWINRYGRFHHHLFEKNLKSIDYFVFQRYQQQNIFKSQYGFDGKVIYSGHPDAKNTNHQKEKILITWIGNLKIIKRPDIFLDIVKELSHKNAEFHMVGREYNNYESEISEFTEKYPNFHYHGFLENSEVLKLLNSSYLLINTSSSEGFSNVFIESWKYGVPVVSFIDPDNILGKYNVGYSCKDKNEMIGKIEFLLNDRNTYNLISENCRKLFESSFTIEKNVDSILELIQIK